MKRVMELEASYLGVSSGRATVDADDDDASIDAA